jgi:hypothetical protein
VCFTWGDSGGGQTAATRRLITCHVSDVSLRGCARITLNRLGRVLEAGVKEGVAGTRILAQPLPAGTAARAVSMRVTGGVVVWGHVGAGGHRAAGGDSSFHYATPRCKFPVLQMFLRNYPQLKSTMRHDETSRVWLLIDRPAVSQAVALPGHRRQARAASMLLSPARCSGRAGRLPLIGDEARSCPSLRALAFTHCTRSRCGRWRACNATGRTTPGEDRLPSPAVAGEATPAGGCKTPICSVGGLLAPMRACLN